MLRLFQCDSETLTILEICTELSDGNLHESDEWRWKEFAKRAKKNSCNVDFTAKKYGSAFE